MRSSHLHQAPPTAVIQNDKGETVVNQEYSSWTDRDLLLHSWIMGTLSEDALYIVVGCKIANEVWNALEENLLQATRDREIQLKQQMQDFTVGSETIGDYIKAFKCIFDGLAAILKPVFDEDKVIYMSRGLGHKYNVLVTSMLAKPPFPSYSQFVTAVQSYGLRLQGMAPPTVDHNIAFFAYHPNHGERG